MHLLLPDVGRYRGDLRAEPEPELMSYVTQLKAQRM